MILFLFLWAVAGLALEAEVELGWSGRPVLDAVNPLWLTLANPGPDLVSGELWVQGEIGSPWRGTATYTAVVPFSLGPFSRMRFLLPWPARVGSYFLHVSAHVGGAKVLEKRVEFVPEGMLRAGIGPPKEPLDVVLNELPADPLLLSPFSEIHSFTSLRKDEEDVLWAWKVFLAGEVRVEAEQALAGLAEIRPPAPEWRALAPGLSLYLLGLGLVLPGLSRGRSGVFLVFLLAFLGFSLFYVVLRESLPQDYRAEISVFSPSFTSFCLESLGIVAWRKEMVRLPGFWVEALPPREWEGRDVVWRFVDGQWYTELYLSPSSPRLLWRIVRKEMVVEGERAAPPSWAVQGFILPWERATVVRVPSELSGEAYFVLLP